MIWQIALGILLGYILIGLIPVVSETISSLFTWMFDVFSDLFKVIEKAFKEYKKLKWYYKLLLFLSFIGICVWTEWFDGIIIAFIIFIFYLYILGTNLIKRFDKWNKTPPKKDFESI